LFCEQSVAEAEIIHYCHVLLDLWLVDSWSPRIIRLSAILSRLMTRRKLTLTLVKMRQLLLPHWRSRVITLLDSFILDSILVDCMLSCLEWTRMIRASLVTCICL